MNIPFADYLDIPKEDLFALRVLAWAYFVNSNDLDVAIDVLLRRMVSLQIGPRLPVDTFHYRCIWNIISLINNRFIGITSDEEKANIAAELGGVDSARLVLALVGTSEERFEQAKIYYPNWELATDGR